MFNWWKQKRCKHDYEILSRGKVTSKPYYGNTYWEVTRAQCTTCGYREVLNEKQIDEHVTDGKLLRVHRDPRKLYGWFTGEEVMNALTRD